MSEPLPHRPQMREEDIWRRAAKESRIEMENTSKCKTLVRDGRWIVPPDERPKNWESLNIPE